MLNALAPLNKVKRIAVVIQMGGVVKSPFHHKHTYTVLAVLLWAQGTLSLAYAPTPAGRVRARISTWQSFVVVTCCCIKLSYHKGYMSETKNCQHQQHDQDREEDHEQDERHHDEEQDHAEREVADDEHRKAGEDAAAHEEGESAPATSPRP